MLYRLNCQLAEENNKVETATSDKEVIELELVEFKSTSQDRVLKLEADLMKISQEFATERKQFAVDLLVKTAELAEEQEKAKDLQQQLEKCEFELSTAIKDLQQRVFELNYMVNQSGNELHDLREAANTKENQFSQTIKTLTSKNAGLNKELEAVTRELSLNVEANTVMGKTIAKLGFDLMEAEKTIKTLTEQLAQAKTDHEGKVQELETKTNKKKEKLTKVKEDVKKLEEQNSELVQETTL
jgi:chromosome segregation ATPase